MLFIILGVILSCICVFKVKADDLEELNKAITAAQIKFDEANLALKNTNEELYFDFINFMWSDKFQRAEKILREQFPKEYYEYITAKSSLDELLYLSFTVKFNQH